MDLRRNSAQLWVCCIGFALGLSACNVTMQANNQTSAAQLPEAPYCGSPIAISGLTTAVSGVASFNYRALDISTCGGLCGNPVTKVIGIPYAEVHVVDAGGTVIQCGETDGSGNFSGLQIPRTAGSYSVQVFSRSLNSMVKASVLEDIYSSIPYSVSAAFSTTAGQVTVTGLSMTASAQASVNAKIPGGGFNILADIYWANQFLRAQSGNATFVADKVTVFWKAGFNPYSYFGSPNALASFYVSSEDRLYILGGKNGDVKNSDTDHFDDSVILHEYGHFLEAHYGHSDSPGGSHNGDFIIDPRLAWSEGWANYFQGAVLDSVVYAAGGGPKGNSGFGRYVDTIGYKSDPIEGSGASAGILITRDLTEAASTAAYDRPATNEGIFREFSISRTLFKTFRASIPFSAVWAAFTGLHDVTTVVSPPHKFINFGLFNYNLNLQITTPSQNTTWQGILTEEKQKADTSLYGDTVSEVAIGTGCAPTTMTPVADATYGYDRSNQLMSNDFYTYKHDGVARTITLTYSAGTPIQDLNLYMYSSDYYYSEEVQEAQAGFTNSTLLRTSKTINVSSSTQSETVDLSGLPAGYYMIVVKAATLNRTAASLTGTPNYYLYSSTVNKCLTPN